MDSQHTAGSSRVSKRDEDLIAAVRLEVDECEAEGTLPERFGRYRILDTLGRGGMGVVYRAMQEHTKRTVALKVIAPGLATLGKTRRFAREVELLGQLHHPGIVQVFEANVVRTERGSQPFFAMELIDGRRLTDYVESHELSTSDRLALLAEVCDAVQHAHQKGVIHRDLKPANILVDEGGHPKVLDFGVACATGTGVQAMTTHSSTGQLIGTLPYMSPEQVADDASLVDTRSDVYALGVVGYELLTGRLPYDIRNKPIPEAARILRDENPAPLSATHKRLRGELDTIFTKALEKDVNRRYASVSDLSSDIRRYLRNEPIHAAPPSAIYRLRKFARRNRALSTAVLVGVLGLLTTSIGTSVGMVKARRAEAEAIQARAETLDAQRETIKEARTAKQLAKFLKSLFVVNDPNVSNPEKLTLREILDRGAKRVGKELSSEHEVRASLQLTLSEIFSRLGIIETAHELCAASLTTRRELLGPDHPDTLATMHLLGTLLRHQGKLDESEALQRNVVHRCQSTLGTEHSDTLQAMRELAAVLILKEDLLEAEDLLRKVLQLRLEDRGPSHPSTIAAKAYLATALRLKDERVEAEQLYREALTAFRALLGEEHPNTLTLKNNLVALLLIEERGEQLAEANKLSLTVVEECRRHPERSEARITLDSLHNRAAVLRTLGRLDEAEEIILDVLREYRRLHGEEHAKTLTALNTYATVLEEQDRLEEAETIRRKLLMSHSSTSPAGHSRSLVATMKLAALLDRLEKCEESEQLFQKTIHALEGRPHPNKRYLACARGSYGHSLRKQNRHAEAEPLLRAAYQGLTLTLHKEHRYTKQVIEDLVELCAACGRPDEAAEWRLLGSSTSVASSAEEDTASEDPG